MIVGEAAVGDAEGEAAMLSFGEVRDASVRVLGGRYGCVKEHSSLH